MRLAFLLNVSWRLKKDLLFAAQPQFEQLFPPEQSSKTTIGKPFHLSLGLPLVLSLYYVELAKRPDQHR